MTVMTKYELKSTSPEGVTTSLDFEAGDLWDLSLMILRFVNSCGFDKVDMLEFTDPDGELVRAEIL